MKKRVLAQSEINVLVLDIREKILCSKLGSLRGFQIIKGY